MPTFKDWLGNGAEAMQAANISLQGMRHVKTQHYQINCNWKVFCDNYLVRISTHLSVPVLVRVCLVFLLWSNNHKDSLSDANEKARFCPCNTVLSVFGQLSGTQAKGKPRDTWQSTVFKDLFALHVEHNWLS